MLIDLVCPTCGATFRINREVAGPQWTCGGCGTHIDVPQDSGLASAPPPIDDVPVPNPVEMIAWERFRVATQIAAWGGALGFTGTLLHGGISFILVARPDAMFAQTFSLYFSISIAAATLLMLEFGFAVVAAGACRSSNVALEARSWGQLSLIALAVPIVMLLILPFLLSPIGADVVSLATIMNTIFFAGYLGYLGGHGCLACGFVGSVDPNGRSGLRVLLITYLWLLAALICWAMYSLFMFADDGAMNDPLILGGGPFRGIDEGWIQLLIYVVGSTLQFGYFRHISRRADALARRQQTTVV